MIMEHKIWDALGGYKYLIIFFIGVCIAGVYGLILILQHNERLIIFFSFLIIISVVVIVIILKLTTDRKEMIKRQKLDRIIAEEKAQKEQKEAEERTKRERAEAEEKAKRDKVEAEKRARKEQSEADAKNRREQEKEDKTSDIWMKKDVEILIEELGNPNVTHRLHAAFFLGVRKEKRAVNALIEALQDRDSNVVANVIYALGEIGDPQALEPLQKLNDVGIEKLRRIAIEKLKQTKEP